MVGEDKKNRPKDPNGSSSTGKQPHKSGPGSADPEPHRRQSKKKIRSSQSVRDSTTQRDVLRGEDFLRRAGFKEGNRPGKIEALDRMRAALLEKERMRKERAKSRGKPSSAKKQKKDKADKDQKVHESKRHSSRPKKDAK